MSLLAFTTVRRGLQLAAVGLGAIALAGCSDSADNSAAGTTEASTTETTATETTSGGTTGTTASTAQAYFVIDEIGVGDVSYVTLTNFTDVPEDLAGLVLCQGADCAVLPAKKVAKGNSIHVAAGDGEGVPGEVVTTDLGDFEPSNGEVAIYASGSAGDPQEIVSYLEWGSTPHERTQEAIDAGLWRTGSYAPTAENAVKLVRKVESGWWVFETG